MAALPPRAQVLGLPGESTVPGALPSTVHTALPGSTRQPSFGGEEDRDTIEDITTIEDPQADAPDAVAVSASDNRPASSTAGGAGDERLDHSSSRLSSMSERTMDSGLSLTREDLMERGLSATQADAILVRLHEEEVLLRSFRGWILCFHCLVAALTPAMLGILVWMAWACYADRSQDCDVPLQQWVLVVLLIVVYNSSINRPTPEGSFIVRRLCRFHQDPENMQPSPTRVRVYNAFVSLFIFSWNCVGLHWVRISGEYHKDDCLRSRDGDCPDACQDVAPNVFLAVKVYAAFNLAFTIFMYVNLVVTQVGYAHLLRVAMYRGMLHTNKGAPKGCLEKTTEVVVTSSGCFSESDSCSICLEDFIESDKEARKIKACGHVFHKDCLRNWLKVDRVCPLCRTDLAGLTGVTTTQPAPA
eukprot:TRINITY_DN41291_c0_g1_i2.p1 TRINITY_DN41291_c0_g1~~TRINITY_DN41291_c0_g1_i2.p1  ORF type:complete len:416 (-),score=68.11 TRINITY_DN41291_c0_g1_i2:81-1328(-)